MVRDANRGKPPSSTVDPREPASPGVVSHDAETTSLATLEERIAIQTQIVTMLRDRKQARERVLAQVRAALEAGRSAEVKALNSEVDTLRRVASHERTTGAEAVAPNDGSQRLHTATATTHTAPESAPHAVSDTALSDLMPSPTAPSSLGTTADLVCAQADLAALLRSVTASLTRAQALSSNTHDTTEAEVRASESTVSMTMDDLIGLTEEHEDAKWTRAQRKKQKRGKRRDRCRGQKAANRHGDDMTATTGGTNDDVARAEPTRTKREQAQRRALFDALDAVVGLLPPRRPRLNAASTTRDADGTITTPQIPAWLQDEEPIPGVEAAKEGGAVDTSVRTEQMARERVPCESRRESEPPHDARAKVDEGLHRATEAVEDEAPQYSDDFEDDEDDGDVGAME